MPRHRRLGDLVGVSLLADGDERVTVNRVGDDVQLVRMGADFRAWAETVPPDDRESVAGWISTAERVWGLRGLDWRFETLQEGYAAWQQRGRPL